MPRSEESNRCVCDLEISTIRRPRPDLACWATEDDDINLLAPEFGI